MDVPLQCRIESNFITAYFSFNPCFSGCTSSISLKAANTTGLTCFNPCFSGCTSSITRGHGGSGGSGVSILVLVDVPLQLIQDAGYISLLQSFNPCFSGCTSSIRVSHRPDSLCESFNPCFSGCTSSILKKHRQISTSSCVSILVLVDVPLQS